jgi:hypothetical protein
MNIFLQLKSISSTQNERRAYLEAAMTKILCWIFMCNGLNLIGLCWEADHRCSGESDAAVGGFWDQIPKWKPINKS